MSSDLYRRISKQRPVEYLWSICILTLDNRFEKLQRLLIELKKQTFNQSIQILWLGDNKSWSVGEKRNRLWDIASGRYLCFIDDDDMIGPDYVKDILSAISDRPDVITFQVDKRHNGNSHRIHRYAKKYGLNHLDPEARNPRVYNMLPDHLCVWNRDVLFDGEGDRLVPFPDVNIREDHLFAQGMREGNQGKGFYEHEKNINKILYIYDYETDGSQTHRQH